MIADRIEVLNSLVSGGDDRLVLDLHSHLNMYGYGPAPVEGERAFSSSTASTITRRGFAAATDTYDRLAEALARDEAAAAYAREAEGIRHRLATIFGIENDGSDTILAASGTDLHLIVAALMHGRHRRPVLTLSLTGSETGSGVGLAAAGRHAMAHPVSGRTVVKGDPIGGNSTLAATAIAVRDAIGDLRPEADVAADLDQAIETAIGDGRQCILVATDVSKTGLIAPALETVFALKARFGDRLDILVDACQLRVAPETVRAYLARGCLVAVTGSKFIAGPIFSGALLVPAAEAAALKTVAVDASLGDYSGRGDWPVDWRAAEALPDRPNIGLLLRWQAALAELEAMLDHHPLKRGWVTLRFADAVESRLRSDPRFQTIDTRRLDRSALAIGDSYDCVPTIFPFLLRTQGRLLDSAAMSSIYQWLAKRDAGRPPVRLGQPVALGQRAGQSVSALRLCLSAPLVTAASAGEDALATLIDDAMAALDGAAELAETAIARVA